MSKKKILSDLLNYIKKMMTQSFQIKKLKDEKKKLEFYI